MPLQPVACAECGAPMRVPEDVRFVSCEHCNAQLELRDGDGAVYAKLRGLAEDAAGVRRDVSALRAQADLEQLEKEWQAGEWGAGPPNPPETLMPAVIIVMACAGGFVIAGIVTDMSFLFGFAIFFLALGVFGAYPSRRKKRAQHDEALARYQQALADYEAQREELRAETREAS